MTEQTKNPVGRPRTYETPEQFDAKVNAYAAHCKVENEPATWTGLALFLGFSSRQSIDEYLKYEGFSDSVKRAKAFVEMEYEKRLSGNAAAGAIFALKNYGWTDRTEVELDGTEGFLAALRDTTKKVMVGGEGE